MLTSNLHNILHILAKSKLFKRLRNMLTSNSFLAFFFGDLVGFGGDEGYEFDAAFDEQVAGVFSEGETGGGGQDFGYDFLDGC
jgi:hypothetical protein